MPARVGAGVNERGGRIFDPTPQMGIVAQTMYKPLPGANHAACGEHAQPTNGAAAETIE